MIDGGNDNHAVDTSAKAVLAAVERAAIEGYYAAMADLSAHNVHSSTFSCLFDAASFERHPFLHARLQDDALRTKIAEMRVLTDAIRRDVATRAAVAFADLTGVVTMRGRDA